MFTTITFMINLITFQNYRRQFELALLYQDRHYFSLLTNLFNRFNHGYDELLTDNHGLGF